MEDFQPVGLKNKQQKPPLHYSESPNLKPAEELQNGDHANNDAGQAGADGDPSDGFLLESIEAFAEARELSLHPVAAILAADDDFQGE